MRFAIITDTHFAIPGTVPDGVWWYKVPHSMDERRYASIKRSLKSLSPDFIAVCGDFTADCRRESFLLGKGIMDSIGCEWRTAVGNHDTNWPGVREEISSLYSLPDKINYYSHDISIEKHVLHFIFLDLCQNLWRDGSIRPHVDQEAYDDGDILKFAIDDKQLEWFDKDLTENRHKINIVITHTPVYYRDSVYVGTLPKAKEPFNDMTSLNLLNPELEAVSEKKLKEVINKHKDIITAVFSGHTHINEVIYAKGIPFCTTAALRECPFEFRMAEVTDRSLDITMHKLDDESIYEASYERWRGNEWIFGKPEDRELSIQLKPENLLHNLQFNKPSSLPSP